ncbi:hypothetical protein OJAV_G00145290 [Oryzias javanicus]|uniref:Uncharacterized protein n=1 Tax=Oryzias javanicus TaxID=123683 RepID=A0A3S2PLV3_ORYJA|nr:hypothetical protein OJAV_G00145290 [Oryzias javanicus]
MEGEEVRAERQDQTRSIPASSVRQTRRMFCWTSEHGAPPTLEPRRGWSCADDEPLSCRIINEESEASRTEQTPRP